jgi:cell division protein FtsN
LPFFLLLGLLVLAVLAGAVFWFYRSGIRGAGDAPQPVGTPIGEIMAPAPDQTGPGDPNAGLQVYKADELSEGEPTFTPPPEQPKARPTTKVETAALPPAGSTPAPKTKVEAPAPKPAPAPAPAPTTSASGAFAVQIGAFSSRALAEQGWNEAVSVGGGSGFGKTVEEVDVNGTTLYRTRVTGFTSRDGANAFCNAWKAAGRSCFVR